MNKFKNGASTIENILNQVTKVNGTDGIVNRAENIKPNNSTLLNASTSSIIKEKNSKISKLKNFLSNISNSLNNSLNSGGSATAINTFPKIDSTNIAVDEFNPLSIEEKEDSIHENNDKSTHSSSDPSKLRVDNCNLKEVRYRDRSLNASIRSVTSSASKLTVFLLWN